MQSTLYKTNYDGRVHPTVGLIIIGDEILKGHTQDTNSFYLCQQLHSLGLEVKKISIIPDSISSVATEVKEFSETYSFVITSGGVGPTHDDVTYAGVASAFEEVMIENETLKKTLSRYESKENACKMAMVPKSASIHYIQNKETGEMFAFPVISVKNVYILPGVPEFLQMAFDGLTDVFREGTKPIYMLEMYLNLNECDIIAPLDKAIEVFEHRVVFGTYPANSVQNWFKAKLTIESESIQSIQLAFAFLQNEFPPTSVVFFTENVEQNAAMQVFDNFMKNSAENELKHLVRSSLDCIEECFDKFKMSEVCISFNGGKDSVVLLHLVEAVRQKKYFGKELKNRLKAVYFRDGETFPEVDEFIEETASK